MCSEAERCDRRRMFQKKFASKVIGSVMHECGKMTATKLRKKKRWQTTKMEFIWDTMRKRLRRRHLDTVVLKNTKTTIDSCSCQIHVSSLAAILAKTELFRGVEDKNRQGLSLRMKNGKNSRGLFRRDVREKFLKQVFDCVGDGAIADMRRKILRGNRCIEIRLWSRQAGIFYIGMAYAGIQRFAP